MRAGRFLRTSAWFAALLVTTKMVVAELRTLLLRFRGPRYARELLDRIFDEPSHLVVEVDQELRTEAIDRWLRPFPNQRFSLTDGVSSEVIRRKKLRKALALDRHFIAAGFEILS